MPKCDIKTVVNIHNTVCSSLTRTLKETCHVQNTKVSQRKSYLPDAFLSNDDEKYEYKNLVTKLFAYNNVFCGLLVA
jgi:hypothetical protein